MYCMHCGKSIPENSKFCPECGTATIANPITDNSQQFGQTLMNKTNASSVNKKKKKGCFPFFLIALLLFLVLCVVLAVVMPVDTKNNGVDIELPSGVEANEYSIVKEELTATDDTVFAVFDVFEKCEIGTVIKFEYDNLLDNMYTEGQKGFRLTTDIAKNIILYINADGSVYALRYLAEDLYIDGQVVAKLTNFIVLNSEASTYYAKCQTYLKDYVLKSPSTAEFPFITEWAFGKEDGNIIVQGYVDAQNGFGAMLRSDFQFIIDTKTDTVISLIFDGKELIQ